MGRCSSVPRAPSTTSARISSEASGRFHQDMNGSRTRREQPDRQPGRHQQHDQRGQQHALVALPQHGPDFLRVQQIDEVQAVRARVVFGDELRRGNFQQHVQHPPDAEPPGGRARGRRGGRTTARTPRAARSPWTAGTHRCAARRPAAGPGRRRPARSHCQKARPRRLSVSNASTARMNLRVRRRIRRPSGSRSRSERNRPRRCI